MIYLDNAATSFPKPSEVLEKTFGFAKEGCGNAGRSGHRLSLLSAELIENTRDSVCELFSYGFPQNVIFTPNATFGLNLAIQVYYTEGSHVLVSDMEHNAVMRPLEYMKQCGKITYDKFPHQGDIIANIKNSLKKNTDMLICTHVSNVNGYVFPIKEIGEFCHNKGITFIIDGSQGAGHMVTDLSGIRFSAYCSPGHKGLLGLQGSGFVILDKEDPKRDFISGGGGSDSFLELMPRQLPDRYEAGTQNAVAIYSMSLGIDYLLKHKQKSQKELCRYLCEGLREIKGVGVYTEGDFTPGIAAFIIEGIHSSETAQCLSDADICVRGGFHCAPSAHITLNTCKTGLVRISLGFSNTKDEIDTLLDIVRNCAAAHLR